MHLGEQQQGQERLAEGATQAALSSLLGRQQAVQALGPRLQAF